METRKEVTTKEALSILERMRYIESKLSILQFMQLKESRRLRLFAWTTESNKLFEKRVPRSYGTRFLFYFKKCHNLNFYVNYAIIYM